MIFNPFPLSQQQGVGKMNGKFIVLNKRNGGCPICQGTDGDCRQSDDDRNPLYLCRPSRGDVPGFNFIGETNDGVWGKYFIDRGDDWKGERRSSYQPKPYTPKKVVSQALPVNNIIPLVEKPPAVLSADDRDKEYNKVLDQLCLTQQSKADLTKRGLNDEQINQLGCKSIGLGISLKLPVDNNLPGIGKSGRYFRTGADGYIVPVFDIHKRMVSYQQKILGGKYIWAKNSHTKEFGELPLQHAIRPDWKPGDDLYKSEGTLKPWIASVRLGLSFIGAAGGQFASSPLTYKNSLNILQPGRVILTPDSGSLTNPNVLHQYRKNYFLLKSWGYQLYVLDYGQGQRKKSKPDIDELISVVGEVKPYQDWDVCCEIEGIRLRYEFDEGQWRKTCGVSFSINTWHNSPGLLSSSYKELNSIVSTEWQNKRKQAGHFAWSNAKKYTPDVVSDERFCISVPAPKSGECAAILFHTSQGKTTKIIDWFTLGDLKDLGAIKIGYRNSLEHQFIFEAMSRILANGLPNYLQFYHLNADKASLLTKDPSGRVSLCADSLDKIDNDDFTGKVIILDEVESVMRHLLFAGTLGDRQNIIIEKFKTALRNCDRIVLADGNLTDASCDYIEKISGKKITKYYNKQLPPRPLVKIYDSVGKDFKLIAGQIATEKLPWIMSDTQIDCEAMDRDLFQFDGSTNLRIDGKTINEGENPDIRLFFESPDTVIDSGKYKRIITSPTVESGLSVTSQNISGVYLLAKHLEVNSLIQMIIRERVIDIPRHVCIADYVNRQNDPETTLNAPFARTIARNFESMMRESVLALGEEFGTDRDLLINLLMEQAKKALESPEQKLYEQYLSIANYEKANLANCLKETLQNAGYPIEIINDEKAENTNYKECKKQTKKDEAQQITEAKGLTPAEYESMEKRQDLKWHERCSVTKYRMLQQLPGIGDNWEYNLVFHLLFENPKLINQSVIRWLCENPELAKKRAEKNWHRILKFDRQYLGNFKDELRFVKEVNRLSIPSLLEKLTTETYTNDTAEVSNLWQQWGAKQRDRTGIERGAKPSTLISRLARKLGYQQSCLANKDSERSFVLIDLLSEDFGPVIKKCTNDRLTLENSPENHPENVFFDFGIPKTVETISDNNSSQYNCTSGIYIKENKLYGGEPTPGKEYSDSPTQKPIAINPYTKNSQKSEGDGTNNIANIGPNNAVPIRKHDFKIGDFVRFRADEFMKYQITSISNRGNVQVKDCYGQRVQSWVDVLVPWE